MACRRLLIVFALSVVPSMAAAQGSSWGVIGSVTPTWNRASSLGMDRLAVLLFDADTVDLKGSEFTIGIARGRDLGGDWGVSFLRKRVNDGSRVESLEQFCESGKCFTQGESRITRNVVLNGLEVHKFVPFGTIKRRVQIGLNVGFGFGSLSGESETHRYDVNKVSADSCRQTRQSASGATGDRVACRDGRSVRG
jgi:hypothetical protein